MAHATLLVALAVFLAGCYRHVPVRIGAVPPGAEVRLRLSEEGVERVEDITGVRRAQVSGELLQWAEEVMISVAFLTSDGQSLRQQISVDADEVVSVDVRELDRTRTAVLAAGVGAVVGTAIVATVVKIIGGSSQGGQPPPGEGGGQPGPSVSWGFGPAFLRGFH